MVCEKVKTYNAREVRIRKLETKRTRKISISKSWRGLRQRAFLHHANLTRSSIARWNRTATVMAALADRRRINAPSGGTSAPVFAKTVKETGYLESLRPRRTRGPNELRKTCEYCDSSQSFQSCTIRAFLELLRAYASSWSNQILLIVHIELTAIQKSSKPALFLLRQVPHTSKFLLRLRLRILHLYRLLQA